MKQRRYLHPRASFRLMSPIAHRHLAIGTVNGHDRDRAQKTARDAQPTWDTFFRAVRETASRTRTYCDHLLRRQQPDEEASSVTDPQPGRAPDLRGVPYETPTTALSS